MVFHHILLNRRQLNRRPLLLVGVTTRRYYTSTLIVLMSFYFCLYTLSLGDCWNMTVVTQRSSQPVYIHTLCMRKKYLLPSNLCLFTLSFSPEHYYLSTLGMNTIEPSCLIFRNWSMIMSTSELLNLQLIFK